MYDVAQSKNIRRSELDADSIPFASDASVDSDSLRRLQNSTRLQYEELGKYDRTTPQDEREPADSIAFRLFAPSNGQASTQLIRLRSPTPTESGTTTTPGRPDSYYFTGLLDETLALQYDVAAVSGQQVIDIAQRPWPGLMCAWKLTHIPQRTTHKGSLPTTALDTAPLKTRRLRLGKKGRIKSRIASAALKSKQDQDTKAHEEKERSAREKRAKRNRGKQAKKRARNKLKGAVAGNAAASGQTSQKVGCGTDGDDGDRSSSV